MNKIKSKKPIIFISSLAAIFAAAIPSFSTSSAPVSGSNNAIKNINEQSATEVFSYVDVFESYYEKATNALLNNGLEMTLSFDEFCDGYYSNNDDIATYTDNVIDNVINNKKNTSLIKTTTLSASYPDTADYILKSYTDYTTTPTTLFRRRPVYDGTTYDYTLLFVGDIVYHTKGNYYCLDDGHTAIVTDVSHSSAYGFTYVQTIEAIYPKVSYGFLDDTRMVDYGVEILRVIDTTPSSREQVLYFVNAQIGKTTSVYVDIKRLNTSITSSLRYCSELVYAAYKYIGMDLTMTITSGGKYTNQTNACYPSHIYNSINTYVKGIVNKYFLDLQLAYGSTWTVKIYNNTQMYRYVYYNSKMAFESDAKNWTSLSDNVETFLDSGKSKTVRITTNWFATSITASIVYDNKRYITYAKNLSGNSDGYSMNIYYNIVSA